MSHVSMGNTKIKSDLIHQNWNRLYLYQTMVEFVPWSLLCSVLHTYYITSYSARALEGTNNNLIRAL